MAELFKFSDLDLSNEEIEVDVESLPEEVRDIREPPQPGKGYTFQIPTISLDDPIWEKFAAGKEGEKERFAVNLREPRRDEEGERVSRPLVIIGSPFAPRFVGDPLNYRLSNMERQFREGEPAVSEMGYFLKGLGIVPANTSQHAWVKAMLKASGKQFQADVDWEGYCNENRELYVVDPDSGQGERKAGTQGCGTRFRLRAGKRPNKKTGAYTLPIPRDEVSGDYFSRFTCACGGEIFIFTRLHNYRPVAQEAAVVGGNGADQAVATTVLAAPTPRVRT